MEHRLDVKCQWDNSVSDGGRNLDETVFNYILMLANTGRDWHLPSLFLVMYYL